tara:strand:+ start:3597 stop:4139 length:543 start_codon:yes stop_codon:yes gene_type:complete
MKKITFIFLLCSTFIFAQNQVDRFEATAEGFPNYVVLEFPDKTANEIFTQVQKWAQYNLRNSKDATYSEIQNEYVAYSLFIDRAFKVDAFYGIDYDLELRIKEGKLRIDLKVKSMPLDPISTGADLTFSKGLNSMFKNNGEPRTLKDRQMKRQAIDYFANGLVASIENAFYGKADVKNDW